MMDKDAGPSMDQGIFALGLPVETVSLYLAAGGLTDAGKELTMETFRSIWSGDAESLSRALAGLLERNILAREGECFVMVEGKHWKR